MPAKLRPVLSTELRENHRRYAFMRLMPMPTGTSIQEALRCLLSALFLHFPPWSHYLRQVEMRFGGTELVMVACDPKTGDAVATTVEWAGE